MILLFLTNIIMLAKAKTNIKYLTIKNKTTIKPSFICLF